MMDVREQMERQRKAYEARWGFSDEDVPNFDELSPEEQASVCEFCGEFLNSEMPVAEDEPILCGGDVCYNRETMRKDTERMLWMSDGEFGEGQG